MKRSPSVLSGGALLATALALGACDVGDRAPADDPDGPADGSTAVDTAQALEDSLAALAPTPGVLTPINQSGVRGTTRLDPAEGGGAIDLEVEGLEAGQRYPAHVHEGRCVEGGPVALPLGRVTAGADGTGSLRMRVPDDRLDPAGEFFVQVHAPGGDPLACADLPQRDAVDEADAG